MLRHAGRKVTTMSQTTADATSWQKQHEKQTLTNQSTAHKIEMIKSLKKLTRLLGLLNLKCCVTDVEALYSNMNIGRPPGFPLARPPYPGKYSYGWGLKESKDAVEAYLDRKALTPKI